MGGPGSGRKKSRSAVRCAEHPGSSVKANGTYTTATGQRRRYLCTPIGDDPPHRFSVQVRDGNSAEDELTALFEPRWSPKPKCAEHPDGYVVRDGTYGLHTPKRRQRYRCYPNPTDRATFHRFTPPLPRDHVCEGDEHCKHCEELRGIHRGETTVARRHSWPTRIVVRGLEQLAGGATYADVSRWALRVTNTTRTKRPDENADASDAANTSSRTSAKKTPKTDGKPKKSKKSRNNVDQEKANETADASGDVETTERRRSAGAVASRNSWHVAADWVEAFAPPIWANVDTRLRSDAAAHRRRLDGLVERGEPLDYPQVILVDDVPVYGRDPVTGIARRDGGFYVLALAEVFWAPPTDCMDAAAATTKLRLLRAMAKSNTAAWRLMFDELGYQPDFVVADAGTGIAAAFDAHYTPDRTTFIPSLWHLSRNIEKAFSDTPGAFAVTAGTKQFIEPLAKHMRAVTRHKALANTTAWTQWWDDLDQLLRDHHLPVETVRERRLTYEPAYAGLLDDIHAHPQLPISTGGLETLIAKHVHPVLAMRRSRFANLERTNMLLDLVVAKHHGAFDEPGDIVELLRNDNNAHGGWTVPLRTIADPKAPGGASYSSLRDATLIAELAEQRGLT